MSLQEGAIMAATTESLADLLAPERITSVVAHNSARVYHFH
jgi:hypothetical protein